MNPELIAEIYTAAYGTQILTRGAKIVQRPGWYQVISPGNKTPSRNEIVHSSCSENEVEDLITKSIEEYEKIGTAFKWCTSPLTKPIDLPERLHKRGFKSWRCRDMFLSLEKFEKVEIPELKIEELNSSNLETFVETYLKGWILDHNPTATEKSESLEDYQWVLKNQKDFCFNYLATFKGQPVGTASYFLKDKSGYLMGGNILKAYRGHGFYKALVFHRLEDMKKRGRNWAISAARENTSAPILEKLGFKTAFRSSVFQWKGILPE